MKRIWNNRSSARGWGKAAAVFTMAMVLAVGGLGAAMNLADLQGAVTVQPIVRQQSETEPEQKTKLFGKKQTGSAASSEECAADSTEEPRAAEGPTAQAQPEAAEQPAAQTAESETTAEQGEEPAAAENPAEPAQDTAEEPDPLVPGRAEDADPDTTESTETAETAQENSPVILQQETPELAAQDPQAPPEETDAAENDLSGRTPEGTMLLTDEQIRKALDEGALDEAEAQCIDLGDENGFFSWLWNWLFGKKDNQEEYTGWLTKNGKTYYYSASTHKPVTGIQSVDGKLYYFDADGVMQKNVNFGIDVSKYQSNIDWNKVKKAGVNFVIIRIGYRGYGASGTLVQDPMFEEHFTNARNAGLKVGVYFFTQAVTEDEAREEAQGCNWVLNGRKLDYPIYYDTEASTSPNGTGRADGLGKEDRTKCFLEAIMPVCDKYDINMAIHPDDPSWSVFGLPRIISSQAKLKRLIEMVPNKHNGVTFCMGSYGTNLNNDLVATVKMLKGRIHFAHIRNLRFNDGMRDFEESAHLSSDGTFDMHAVMKALYETGFEGPIRPDHGRMIWGEKAMPGYGLYDRALGAAYLCGLWEAIEKEAKSENK